MPETDGTHDVPEAAIKLLSGKGPQLMLLNDVCSSFTFSWHGVMIWCTQALFQLDKIQAKYDLFAGF